MEFKADTIIKDTTVDVVMKHLTDPELAQQWIYGLEDLETVDEETEPPKSIVETINQPDSGEEATATFVDKSGAVEMTNECLFASDDTLTTRTSNQYSDNFSTWQLAQQGEDVQVRQLMLGTHKGLGRFEGVFRKEDTQELIEIDLQRLKSFIETGKIPDHLVPDYREPSKSSDLESSDTKTDTEDTKTEDTKTEDTESDLSEMGSSADKDAAAESSDLESNKNENDK